MMTPLLERYYEVPHKKMEPDNIHKSVPQLNRSLMPTVYDHSCFEVSNDFRLYSMFLKEDGSPTVNISRSRSSMSSAIMEECNIGRMLKVIK